MQLEESFTLLEDGEPIGTFYTYEQAVDHIREHAIMGRRYQIVKELVTVEEPRQTVADTGWRDEYRGMWAEEMDNEALCLVMARGGSSTIWVMGKNTHKTGYVAGYVASSNLVIRPDLAPVNLTPHPAYLETLKDYEGAPTGTVIDWDGETTHPAYVKDTSGDWTDVGRDSFEKSTELADYRRKVLYWPEKGEK